MLTVAVAPAFVVGEVSFAATEANVTPPGVPDGSLLFWEYRPGRGSEPVRVPVLTVADLASAGIQIFEVKRVAIKPDGVAESFAWPSLERVPQTETTVVI